MPDGPALQIALLTHSVNPRGGVVHTLELANALHAGGHEVTVMAPARAGQHLFREMACRVDLFDPADAHLAATDRVRARIDAYVEHLSSARSSKPLCRRFDVLHAQDGIGANALATLTERGLIPGFLRTVHHVEHHHDARINGWEERALRGASRLCCVSGQWQEALLRDYGLTSTRVGNGVDLARFNPRPQSRDAEVALRLGLRPAAPLIVSIGGVEERKNTIRILEAFMLLRRALCSAQLAVVGGASLLDHSRYRTRFDAVLSTGGLKVGPGQDVVLTGVLGDADIPAVLRLARAVAFPSLREGFGLVVLEALASGTPTVVSAIPPFTEYLSGNDVHWADPHDPASIALALDSAVAAPKFPAPAVCARFSWTASAARHVALYQEALGSTLITRH